MPPCPKHTHLTPRWRWKGQASFWPAQQLMTQLSWHLIALGLIETFSHLAVYTSGIRHNGEARGGVQVRLTYLVWEQPSPLSNPLLWLTAWNPESTIQKNKETNASLIPPGPHTPHFLLKTPLLLQSVWTQPPDLSVFPLIKALIGLFWLWVLSKPPQLPTRGIIWI